MMKTNASLVALAAMTVTACGAKDPPKVASAKAETTRTGYAALITESCPLAPSVAGQEAAPAIVAALAGVLGPIIIDKGLKAGADWVKKNEEAKTGKEEITAHRSVAQSDKLGCLIVTHGTFGPEKATPETDGDFGTAFFDNKTVSEELKLTRIPDLYLEFRILHSAPKTVVTVGDGKAKPESSTIAGTIQLEPAYLHYGRGVARNAGSGEKDLAVDFAATGYVAAPSGSPKVDLGQVTVDLGKRRQGMRYAEDAFRHQISQAMMIPPVSVQVPSAKPGGTPTTIPFLYGLDYKVTVREAEDKSQWAMVFADTVEDSRADIKKIVGEEIDKRLKPKKE